jgi:hypothetical protein
MRSVELERFSNNSADLLLKRGLLRAFFDHLGFPLEERGGSYRVECPACHSSFAFVGLNGKKHKLYWRCFDSGCPSNNGKSDLYRNFLGLVRGLVEDRSLRTAIGVISEFLGYKGRSFDITNGKFGQEQPAQDGAPKRSWVEPDEELPF